MCQFTDIDRDIRIMIIQMGTSSKLCNPSLQNPDLNLTDLLSMGQAMEVAEVQAADTKQKQNSDANPQDVMAVSSINNLVKKTYFNCAGVFPHYQERSCPAKGKIMPCHSKGWW